MRITDLTLPLIEGMHSHPGHGRSPLVLPGTVSHGITAQRGISTPYGTGYVSVANEYVILSGHTGTHVDAPYHVDYSSSVTAEKVPAERAAGPGIWLDVSDIGPRGRIDVERLVEAEQESGEEIQADDIVLLHTGWLDANPDDPKRWVDDSPGLTKEAGEWLRDRRIKAVGVDLVSPDLRDALDLPVHCNFLRPSSLGLDPDDYILIIEGLTNIRSIPLRRFIFFGLPLPLIGATGSPIRAIAVTGLESSTEARIPGES